MNDHDKLSGKTAIETLRAIRPDDNAVDYQLRLDSAGTNRLRYALNAALAALGGKGEVGMDVLEAAEAVGLLPLLDDFSEAGKRVKLGAFLDLAAPTHPQEGDGDGT